MTGTASETIFALSSGAPPAAIAIVRVSGPEAGNALRALAGRVPPQRRATRARLRDGAGETLDDALVLWFEGPGTATGENLAELHLHGGRAVVRAVLDMLAGLPGLRAAEPGEFTRRAFLNGRIDLAQAEGLADLLEAESEQARVAALRMAEGGLSRRIYGWRGRLLALAAEVEAALEFGEELEDETLLSSGFEAELDRLRIEIGEALAAPPAERLRDGFRVVVAGPPNSGKSTLINALAGREVAIATPVAGTTRDALEAPVRIGGAAVLLTDTAGLRDTDDEVEGIGIARARAAIGAADMILWLGAAEEAPGEAIPIHGRNDIAGREVTPAACRLGLSASTGKGLDDLRQLILDAATSDLMPDGLSLNLRQRELLYIAARAIGDCCEEADPVLRAEVLREACAAFDAVVGGTDIEALLDGLFGRFCLGK